MNRHSEDHLGRNETRLKIMGLGERAGRKSYFPQLQERIRELEEKRAYLEAKSAELSKMIEELDGARREAEENERRFRDLANLLPQTVFETDLAGRVSFANRIAFDMFGIRPEDVARGLDCLDTLVPEDRARARANMEKTLRGEDLGGQQYTALRTDGCVFPCIVYATAIHGDEGVLGMRGIVVDISDQIRLKEQKDLIEAQYRQSQKMESVGRLAGGVAHDFNNMLGVIIGRAEMALQQDVSHDKLEQHLKEILNAGLRSADFTRQLLAFARKQTAIPQILDLNATISGMLTMLRRLIGEDIDLSWQPGLDLWKVKIDPSQVDQILANLAVNARDAISGVGSITLRAENVVTDNLNKADDLEFISGKYVLLTVSDTGEGMSKEVCEKIFEPFFTTKELGKGTGLGLSTVYGIVKQNDGFIYVDSKLGKGTTFKIYLPQFEVKTERVPSEEITIKRQTGTETLLLVEDDEAILKLSTLILEELGYTVIAAPTPLQAVDLAVEHPGVIHLLITDVVMPKMNGRELAEQLRAMRPNLKCLYMSGYTADVIAHRGILEEGVNFVQKPFCSDVLAAKVREVLDGLDG